MKELTFREIEEKFKNNPTVEIDSKDSIYSGSKGQVVDIAGQRVKVFVRGDAKNHALWYNYKSLKIVDPGTEFGVSSGSAQKDRGQERPENTKIAVFSSMPLGDFAADRESFIVRGENLGDILEKYAHAMQESDFEVSECVIYEGKVYRLRKKVTVEIVE